LANLFCLALPAPTPCIADRYYQDNKRENSYYRDDNNPNSAGTGAHGGLR